MTLGDRTMGGGGLGNSKLKVLTRKSEYGYERFADQTTGISGVSFLGEGQWAHVS
jgi:hypothetical protein